LARRFGKFIAVSATLYSNLSSIYGTRVEHITFETIVGGHLMTCDKIRPNQCLKMFGKGRGFEPDRAIGIRWSTAQSGADRRCQLLPILWIDCCAEHSITKRIEAPVPISADHADAGGHRLKEDDAARLQPMGGSVVRVVRLDDDILGPRQMVGNCEL